MKPFVKKFKSKRLNTAVQLICVYGDSSVSHSSISVTGDIGKIPKKINKWLGENDIRVISVNSRTPFRYSFTNRRSVPTYTPPPSSYTPPASQKGGFWEWLVWGGLSDSGKGLGRIGCGHG